MANNFFVAGTDTDAGKTLITSALLIKAQSQGLKAAAMKPLAAGATLQGGEYKNSDAVLLSDYAMVDLSYQQVNPVLLNTPAAPHISAEKEGRRLSASQLVGFIRGFLMTPADIRFLEGAGGWYVPLNMRETYADVVKPLQLDVILVVGLHLGCLNHTLLSVKAIRSDGLRLVGWVGTQTDKNMKFIDENIETLKNYIAAPCLGVVPFIEGVTPQKAAEFISLPLS